LSIKVAYCYADSNTEWNCSPWRMLYPANAINYVSEHDSDKKDWCAKLIHVSGFLNYTDPAIVDSIMTKNLLIVQRNIVTQGVLDAMQYYRGLGLKVCVDLDDAYWGLGTQWDNPARPFWTANTGKLNPPPLEMLERGLRQSDGLIAPNRVLLADQKHNVRGYYLNNYAASKQWLPEVDIEAMRKERNISSDRIIIGWGGSVSHYNSWWGSGLREAAARLSRRYPELLWMLCGSDTRVYNQLPVPETAKFLQPGVDPDRWPMVVKMFSVGVAPLFSPYDQRRSWIKGLEYMLAGIPWVAAQGEPYGDLAMWGKLVPPDSDAWEVALEETILNLSSERAIAQSRIPMAQDMFLVERNLDVFEKTYNQIIHDTQEANTPLPGLYWVRAKEKS
jgi:hypothetical protein